MTKKTQQQINVQIEGLVKERERLPRYSSFGHPNHDATDAKLEVLRGAKTAEDYAEPITYNEYVYLEAERAEFWLDGYVGGNLFSGI